MKTDREERLSFLVKYSQ